MHINRHAATALAKMMEEQHAISAESFDMDVRGVKVVFVILQHDDQRDGAYQTLHCLGERESGVASLGTIPRAPTE